MTTSTEPVDNPAALVAAMRQAARYIHSLSRQTVVLVLHGEALSVLPTLAQDIALLKAVGVELVLVFGAEPQITQQLFLRGINQRIHCGRAVTDQASLDCIKQVVGELCLEFEAAFSQGLANTPMANAAIRLVSGNLVTAQPIGIVDGIDYQFTGRVRKFDATMVNALLQSGALPLLPPLGFSPTGEVFCLTANEVAEATTRALQAQKLIFLIPDLAGLELPGELVSADLKDLPPEHPLQDYVPTALNALDSGVEKVHFLPFANDGSLLLELFTHSGCGVMVTARLLERLRPASIDDVGGILALIEPLEEEGVLVKRGRALLEREIGHFTVLEHDGIILGCAALYPFTGARMAEMAGLTVALGARNQGGGERLLKHLEGQARKQGLKQLFVLTTRTAHWFIKRGFRPANLAVLPANRQELYNWQRMSQVLLKDL